jgi:hypothetical protein
MTAGWQRLDECERRHAHWRRWGPYLAERQWATVREDYSPHGTAWEYFPHDHARSRAYRWGEDGIAGLSDRHGLVCLALALWNGRDPMLKERLFGLTGNEGNHGEDVKECYFYLDNTPCHTYMRYLYKYPQRAYPYAELVAENARRGRGSPEYELIDTGVFDDDRYWDVVVEYAKATPEDVLVRITAWNRGPEAAALELLPTLWFRNTWAWGMDERRPRLRTADPVEGGVTVEIAHPAYGRRWLCCAGAPELLFTENETNAERLWGGREPHALRQGWHQRLHRARARRRGLAGARRHQDGRALPGPRRLRRGGAGAAAPHGPAAPGALRVRVRGHVRGSRA